MGMIRSRVGLIRRLCGVRASRLAVLFAVGVACPWDMAPFEAQASSAGAGEAAFTPTQEIDISGRRLVSTGRNRYFVLEPGFQIVLEGRNAKLTVTVLDQTKNVHGVATRIVEEREWENGQLAEVSRNFYAIDEQSGDVFYFGEEVDMYTAGKVSSHTGAWLATENGAKPGLMMPGRPKVGMRYYQEIAPGVAMDRAEIVAVDHTVETPAGRLTGCLRTEEGTALDPREREFKTYAPGIGLVEDAELLLSRYGFAR